MTSSLIHCFTSISLSYLDRARVLAETVRQFHPDWVLWLLMSDEEPPGFRVDESAGCFDHVIRMKELDIPNVSGWAFGHSLVELCTAVKGVMLRRLIAEGHAVVYLDPDIALFAPLTDIVAMLDRHSVILTPHVVRPEPSFVSIPENEIESLQHGAYNLGFLAVRNCQEGRRFADWWRDRLLNFCYDDIPGGLFVDQKWCDLVPALFEAVGILRDPGYNVASWNLNKRPIEITCDGRILAANHLLRFFHFTKINAIGQGALERYAYGRTDVFELVRWYRERLGIYAAVNLPQGWWAYGAYTDGMSIPKAHRVAWRTRTDLHQTFPDPFASGPNSFQAWCSREVDS